MSGELSELIERIRDDGVDIESRNDDSHLRMIYKLTKDDIVVQGYLPYSLAMRKTNEETNEYLKQSLSSCYYALLRMIDLRKSYMEKQNEVFHNELPL